MQDVVNEGRLMADVFDPVDERLRPTNNFSHPVEVRVELAPLHFKGLVSGPTSLHAHMSYHHMLGN